MADAAATAGEAPTLVGLSGFIWRRLPPRVGKVSVTLGSLLADGAYLSSWPFAGALLPPTVLFAAFWFAWRHVGFDSNDQIIFLYQWAPLIFMVMASQLGAGLGIWMWLGYVLGDLVWATGPGAYKVALLPFLGSRALADLMLAAGLIVIPAAAQGLARKVMREPAVAAAPGPDAGQRFPATAALQAAIAFVLVFLWAHSTTIQLQQVVMWAGGSPRTHGLFQSMMREAWPLGFVAAWGSATRALAEGAAARMPGAFAWRLELRAAIEACRKAYSLPGAAVAVAVRTALLTLSLAMFLPTWADVAKTAGVIGAVLGVREVAYGVFGYGAQLRARAPFHVRLPAAVVIAYLLSTYLLNAYANSGFTSLLRTALGSIIVFAILLPERAMYDRRAQAATTPKVRS